MRVTSFDKGANQTSKPLEVNPQCYIGNERIVKHKIELLNLAEELTKVSRACKIMGLSRDTFYRYKAAVENGGIDALIDKSRRKPNIKNRIEEMIEAAVVDYAVEQPAHGQVRASNELRKRGIFISPSGVRCVWLRNQLGRFKDRLKALEEKMAQEPLILTEAQVQALEKKKNDDLVSGEIETAILVTSGRRILSTSAHSRVSVVSISRRL